MFHTEIVKRVRDCKPISYSLRSEVLYSSDILESIAYLCNVLERFIKIHKRAPLGCYDLNVGYFIILFLISYSPEVSLHVTLHHRQMDRLELVFISTHII